MQIPNIVTAYVNSLQHNVLRLLSLRLCVCVFLGEMCDAVVSTTDHIELYESGYLWATVLLHLCRYRSPCALLMDELQEVRGDFFNYFFFALM